MAKKQTRRAKRFRLIPLTVTMLSLLLVIKVNDLYLGSRQLKEFYSVREAVAEEHKTEEAKPAEGEKAAEEHPPAEAAAPDEKKPEEAKKEEHDEKDEHAEGDKKEEGEHGEAKKPEPEPKTYGTGKSTLKEIEALKAKGTQPVYTQSELDLLENLSKRRDELDQREKDLTIKAQVLEATDKRINDKIGEMKALQTELSKVVDAYNEKQDTQIKSLVKIYENMKPVDAANIFNEMDMPILLEVIDKMSERKVAPVLAGMNPKRARDVTQELAEMRRAKAVKQGLMQPPALAAPTSNQQGAAN